MNKIRFRLYGKPHERLILVGLCEKFSAEFSYNESTGYAVVTGGAMSLHSIRKTYEELINHAYRALALAHAQRNLSEIPIKTLDSEFMQAFSTIAYSLITGKTMTWKAQTEAQRAGIRAATEL